jgi:hypothetical protein
LNKLTRSKRATNSKKDLGSRRAILQTSPWRVVALFSLTNVVLTFPDFNGKPAVVGFKRFNTQDTRAIKVLDTNFASYIKAGKDIIVTVKMVAAKDLPAGFGLKAEIQASVEYAVSE